jgi:prepilin-type N-terminal cleavage/methylation domain-containing protein
MRRRPSQRGFTLIELMVVVAIIVILGGLMISVSSTSYGASARNMSDQINANVTFARMRAVSSRRWHRIQITTNQVIVWEWSRVGMQAPLAVPVCPADCWNVVQQVTMPNGVTLWDVDPVVQTATGLTPAQDAVMANQFIDFRPDGSTSNAAGGNAGGTIYLADNGGGQFRILIYRATGSSYARQGW